jgi:hypothetical protein
VKENAEMARYLLSVWHDDEYDLDVDVSSPDVQRVDAQVKALNEELERTGAWVFGGAGLKPSSSATVIRPTGAGVSMTDGPYAETKEQMGGFWVIEAPDLDAALDWARKAAAACEGPVELRPIQDEC